MSACCRCGATDSDRIYEFERGPRNPWGGTLRAVVVCADERACAERVREMTHSTAAMAG